MTTYRTDSDGKTYESWTDVSDEISRHMSGFLGATPEQNAESMAEWANDGEAALRDIRACGQEPQFDAEDYERWAWESDGGSARYVPSLDDVESHHA